MHLVGADDRREPVGDHDGRALEHEVVEGRLHRRLVRRVEGRRRLVEEQQGRLLEHRARDGDALLLAAGDAYPLLTGLGRVPVGAGRRRGRVRARERMHVHGRMRRAPLAPAVGQRFDPLGSPLDSG